MGIVVSLIGALLVHYDLMVYFERFSVDWRLRLFEHRPSSQITLVGITDPDLQQIGSWPWPRQTLAQVISKIDSYNPKAIAFDFTVSDPNTADPDQDEALIHAVYQSGKVVMPVYSDNITEEDDIAVAKGALIIPLADLAMVSAGLGHNVLLGDPDGVIRRVALTLRTEQGDLDAFTLAALKLSLNISDETLPKDHRLKVGTYDIPLDDKGLMTMVFAGKPKTFPVIPVNDILHNKVDPQKLKNKIVIFGGSAPGFPNAFPSPYDKQYMTEMEFHGNILNTILNRSFFNTSSSRVNLIIVLLIGFGVTLIFPRFSPVRGFLMMLAIVVIYLGVTVFLTLNRHLLIQIVYPVVSVAGCYLSTVIYGYVLERREKQMITQTFGRYVAPQVVNEILKSGADLTQSASRRTEVTILFVDLSGFTSLSENLPPEEMVKILNRYFNLVVDVIFKYEGTVDKFIGDAVMVVFNAPMPVDAHEVRACKAALEILEGLKELSRDVEAEHGVKLNVSTGVNTGEVVVGNIGTRNRMEYAAIGDNVNIAARLQSFANPGQICISESTYTAVTDSIECSYLGPQKMKGKALPQNVYEVVGVKETTDVQVSSAS